MATSTKLAYPGASASQWFGSGITPAALFDLNLESRTVGGGAVTLEATDASVSSLAGALSVTRAAAAADASVSTMAAALSGARGMAAADASVSALAGSVVVARPLAAAVASASSLAGDLSTSSPGQFEGTVTSASTLASALRVARPVAGALASASALSAALTVTGEAGSAEPSQTSTAGARSLTYVALRRD